MQRYLFEIGGVMVSLYVSTHSRAEAAANNNAKFSELNSCFNTQPRGGGCFPAANRISWKSGFNTQPRGGGCHLCDLLCFRVQFQHTAARRRLQFMITPSTKTMMFQHTAARRRLPVYFDPTFFNLGFQHTAARRRLRAQPWQLKLDSQFQHTAARRRLPP